MHGVGFVPGSRLLVVTGRKGFLALADADRGRVLARATGLVGNVLPPAISADGRLLVTATGDSDSVRLWSLPDMRPVMAPLRFGGVIEDVQVSPDGRRLTVVLVDRSGESGTLEVWDAAARRLVARLDGPDIPTAVRFSPDGGLLAVGYPNGRSQVWSTASWKPATRLLTGDVGEIHDVAISPDGSKLATGSLDRTVWLWDIETQQAIGTPLPGPGRGVGRGRPLLHAGRCRAHRQLRHRSRLPLGHPARVARTPRLRGGRPAPHARRVDRVPTRPRLRPGLLSAAQRRGLAAVSGKALQTARSSGDLAEGERFGPRWTLRPTTVSRLAWSGRPWKRT